MTLDYFFEVSGCEDSEINALMTELDAVSGHAASRLLQVTVDAVYKFRSEARRKLREHPWTHAEQSALMVALKAPPEEVSYGGLCHCAKNLRVSSPRTPIFDRSDVWAQEVGRPAQAFAPEDMRMTDAWRTSEPRNLAEELARRNEVPRDWAKAPEGVW